MQWASAIALLATASLGANLFVRTRAINAGPAGRARWRRVLLVIHVSAAVLGFLTWLLFLFIVGRSPWVAAVSVACLLIAASHGLTMVIRWTPARGRHAAFPTPVRRQGGYFPVHAATLHAMAAASAVTLVAVTLVGV